VEFSRRTASHASKYRAYLISCPVAVVDGLSEALSLAREQTF
jgi:hypothetical protein